MKSQSLFQKDFTLVVIGQIISLFGNAILRFALPLYLLRETNSAALFGLVTACSFLPMIVLSMVGGVLADRVNKRNIMVALDFLTALIILLFTLMFERLPLVPLLVVVLMLLYGISGTYQPTVQASIPALVPESRILSASAVVNQIGALAGLLGPIVGGMLFGAFGLLPILLLSVACFFVSAVMELFLHIPFTARARERSIWATFCEDSRESLRYIRREKPLLAKIIGLISLFNLVLSALAVVGLPVLIVNTLGLSDELLGVSQGVMALGGLCGGVVTAVFHRRLQLRQAHRLLLLCSLSVGVMSLPLLLNAGTLTSYWVLTGASFAIMALATMFSVQMIAAVQTSTPPELVGKVIALMMALSMCAQPIGQALYGVIFERFSGHAGIILLLAAAVSVILSLLARRVFHAELP